MRPSDNKDCVNSIDAQRALIRPTRGGVEAETLLSVANEVLEMYCAAEYHDERGNLDERRGS